MSKYDLSSLKTVLSGGAPLSKEVIEGFVEKYQTVRILQGYGLTESTGIGASTDTLEESRRYGTAGLLSPSMEAKIVDPESGKALPVNQTGELWLRGPSIMKGYFFNPEATSSTLNSEGWLRTGDVCYIDDDGFIFVVDRLKELIKYKGYQVPPAELEALLLTHTEIADAAVIPFPDKEAGQFPMAYVALAVVHHEPWFQTPPQPFPAELEDRVFSVFESDRLLGSCIGVYVVVDYEYDFRQTIGMACKKS
ncbi:hypothetical protein GH714_007100 [Hevea brasiliensis]|uniref:AMP-dependent synthetase/ligase domain-containing protein n=1 Tax=Hevea brasiliensis TaxID=3981 RepID=A0A6A6MCN9_HEVBR|nr:hypothetical protein GH714_007100 [Hevea brasiliensis]